MPSFAFAETVTVTRQTQAKHGDRTNGVAHDVDGCVVWPSTTTEVTGTQDTVTWDWVVLMPPESDVLATDKVTVRDITYDVVGEPSLYKSPLTGMQSGIEVRIQSITG